jgi:hypothetical protein
MRIVRNAAIVILLLPIVIFKHTFAFTINDSCINSLCHGRSRPILPSTVTTRRPIFIPQQQLTVSFHKATATTTKTLTHEMRKKDDEVSSYDGVGRGRYIFVVVLFICIWQFSIPPTFRRAKFCPPACVQERTLCRNPCVTLEEWTNDIVEYYRNGGGIQWDFSIDPNTLAENQQFFHKLFGNNK